MLWLRGDGYQKDWKMELRKRVGDLKMQKILVMKNDVERLFDSEGV